MAKRYPLRQHHRRLSLNQAGNYGLFIMLSHIMKQLMNGYTLSIIMKKTSLR